MNTSFGENDPYNATRVVGDVVMTSSGISALSCLVLFYFYAKYSCLRVFPNPLIFWRAVCDFGFAVQLFMQQLSRRLDFFTNELCLFWSFLTQLFLFGSLAWFFVYVLNYYFTISNPFTHPIERYYKMHLGVWAAAFFTAAMILAIRNEDDFPPYRGRIQLCWTAELPSWNGKNWGLYLGWVVMVWCSAQFVRIVCAKKLRHGGIDATLQNRKTIILACRYHIDVFSLIWMIEATLYAFMFQQPFKDYFTHSDLLPLFYVAILPLNGLFNLVILLYTNWEAIREARKNKQSALDSILQMNESARNPNNSRSLDMSQALINEFLAKFRLGMNCAHQVGHQAARQSTSTNIHVQGGGGGMKQSKVAHNFIHHEISSTGGKSNMLWQEAMDAQVVFKYTIGQPRSRSKCPRFLQTMALDEARDIEFFHYRPNAFKFLRERIFGVSQKNYLDSFQEIKPEDFTGGASSSFFFFTRDRKLVCKTMSDNELHCLMEILDSYCYHMTPKHFRKKALKHRQVLGCNSMINKIYGCYAITLYGKKINLLVVENILWNRDPNLQIHETYDLKGSWVGRLAKYGTMKDENLKQSIHVGDEQAIRIFLNALQDTEFFIKRDIMDYSLFLGIHRCQELRPKRTHHCTYQYEQQQLRVNNSSNHNHNNSSNNHTREQMDLERKYSVMSDNSSNSSYYDNSYESSSSGSRNRVNSSVATTAPHTSYFGGISADYVEGPGIYYMGIIDVLQRFDLSKKIERAIKTWFLCRPSHGISNVPPQLYASRFLLMLIQNLNVSLCLLSKLEVDHLRREGIQIVDIRKHRQAAIGKEKSPHTEYLVRIIRTQSGRTACENWEKEADIIEKGCTALIDAYRSRTGLGVLSANRLNLRREATGSINQDFASSKPLSTGQRLWKFLSRAMTRRPNLRYSQESMSPEEPDVGFLPRTTGDFEAPYRRMQNMT